MFQNSEAAEEQPSDSLSETGLEDLRTQEQPGGQEGTSPAAQGSRMSSFEKEARFTPFSLYKPKSQHSSASLRSKEDQPHA